MLILASSLVLGGNAARADDGHLAESGGSPSVSEESEHPADSPPVPERSRRNRDRYHQMRKAVKNGEILPLSRALQDIKHRFSGRIIKIEAEFEDQHWSYEYKIITLSGHVIEVTQDATSGEILSVEND